MRVLAVNAGSSSLKLSVIGPDDGVVATAGLAPDKHQSVVAALRLLFDQAGSFEISDGRP